MTIIEFFDKAAIENIAGALLCQPDRVILVGNNEKKMKKSILDYQAVLDARDPGNTVKFIPKSVRPDDLQCIIQALCDIVETHEDCVFDLTGGDDLYLVAVGVVMARYEGKVQCHRFNFRSDKLCDCDADKKVCATGDYLLSAEHQIRIYGGELVEDANRDPRTYPWRFDRDFLCDIDSMWEICREDPSQWNAHVGTINNICDLFDIHEGLDVSFDQSAAISGLNGRGLRYALTPRILYGLQKHGIIRGLVLQDTVSFTFKNEQVRRCLTVGGQILELAMAAKLMALKNRDGSPLYHDVRVGAVIDWDGSDRSSEYRTINEIDILAMRGCIPLFISCKNGSFDVEELYKLDAVAERFGSHYAKRILIATELDKLEDKAEYIRARAADMGIRIIDKLDEVSDMEADKTLRSLKDV